MATETLTQQLVDLIQKLETWADNNEPIAASGSWQASGYMHAYRNAANEIRRAMGQEPVEYVLKEYVR